MPVNKPKTSFLISTQAWKRNKNNVTIKSYCCQNDEAFKILKAEGANYREKNVTQ
jgi:hypothetical protein